MMCRNVVRITLTILPAFAITTSLVGCHTYENVDVSNVKSDAIYQTYTVSYFGDHDLTMVYARFRVGGETGTNLNLSGKSSVECNGVQLAPGEFLGRHYGALLPGHSAEYAFVFSDSEGTEFKNTVELPRADFAEDMPDTFSRSEHRQLNFAGPPLAPGEEIWLAIAPTAGTDDELEKDPAAIEKTWNETGTRLGRAEKSGATGVELTPDILSKLSNGPVSIQWIRTFDNALEDSTPAGGVIKGRYCSTLRQVTLTD